MTDQSRYYYPAFENFVMEQLDGDVADCLIDSAIMELAIEYADENSVEAGADWRERAAAAVREIRREIARVDAA